MPYKKMVRKNQEEPCMFGFRCVDSSFRETEFKGLCKRPGSGMLFTAEGKMLIHSNSFSLCIKRGYCHAFATAICGFAITCPA